MADRRGNQRSSSRLRVRFWPPDRPSATGAGFTKDLSTGGAYIVTPQPLPGGSRVRLELQTGGAGFLIEAVVVRGTFVSKELQPVKPAGMAVRFLHVSDVVARLASRGKAKSEPSATTELAQAQAPPEAEVDAKGGAEDGPEDGPEEGAEDRVGDTAPTGDDLEVLYADTGAQDLEIGEEPPDTKRGDGRPSPRTSAVGPPSGQAPASTPSPPRAKSGEDELALEQELEGLELDAPPPAAAAPARSPGAFAMAGPEHPRASRATNVALPEATGEIVERALPAHAAAGEEDTLVVALEDRRVLRTVYERDLRFGGLWLRADRLPPRDSLTVRLELGPGSPAIDSPANLTQKFQAADGIILAVLFNDPRAVADAVKRQLDVRPW